jgi:hypothetical protein
VAQGAGEDPDATPQEKKIKRDPVEACDACDARSDLQTGGVWRRSGMLQCSPTTVQHRYFRKLVKVGGGRVKQEC